MDSLRICREAKGYSQKYVALAIGVAPPQISKWESGTTLPTLDKLIKLAELYEVTLDEIVGRSVTKEEHTLEETQLIAVFRQLTTVGREMVLGNAKMVLSMPEMRKQETSVSAM